jgi:hypothetical protein
MGLWLWHVQEEIYALGSTFCNAGGSQKDFLLKLVSHTLQRWSRLTKTIYLEVLLRIGSESIEAVFIVNHNVWNLAPAHIALALSLSPCWESQSQSRYTASLGNLPHPQAMIEHFQSKGASTCLTYNSSFNESQSHWTYGSANRSQSTE